MQPVAKREESGVTSMLGVEDLPVDFAQAALVGRAQLPEGASPILVVGGRVHDMSRVAPTVSQLLERPDPADSVGGADLGPLEEFTYPLLAPFDLQCIKACGVTFAESAVERVIEERAGGDASRAQQLRHVLGERIGGDIRSVRPGSPEAARLKAALIDEGLWSQYLEVAIGPDAEVFTKCPVLAAVGTGAEVGVRSDSSWNNPEPEIVLAVTASGKVVGASLGNDVNLRDFEGRSALLLGKGKDNNASCAIGPFIRLFDENFTMDDVRAIVLRLEIEGDDGFRLEGSSEMAQISRDPLDLVRQTLSDHQYPDGFALFLGTLFAPVQDRDVPGSGFTHKVGDRVRISTPQLGALVNRVVHCGDAPPWRTGIAAFMGDLAARGLLGTPGARLGETK